MMKYLSLNFGPKHKLAFPTLICALAFQLQLANAQTAIPTPSQAQQNGNQGIQSQVPRQPVAESTVIQTTNHINGNYTKMERVVQGGQIQEAWDEAENNSGIYTYKACKTCSYKMLLREYMTSVIKLPEGEKITDFEVGDPAFNPVQVDDRTISILPEGYGMDTSLLVYGEDGRLYPFYLRAEGVNSKNIPDLVVRITGNIQHKRPKANTKTNIENQTTDTSKDLKDMSLSDMLDSAKEQTSSTEEKDVEGDFVENVPYDISKLHGWHDYELWGEGWPKNQKPETVFRDERFTYIQFGKNWKNLELPSGYIVIDEIDELVNTRVDGTTFIIESTSNLISLKSGEIYLCLKYVG